MPAREAPGPATSSTAPAGAALRLSGAALAARARDEWLLTDGLGGFASGTVSGVPERRYHAWLNAATKPPVGRMATLVACAEWLVVQQQDGSVRRIELSSFAFRAAGPVKAHASQTTQAPELPGPVMVHPRGIDALVAFERDLAAGTCAWTYRPSAVEGSIEVVRELTLVRHASRALVRYTVRGERPARAWLEVRPLLAMRDFHALVADVADTAATADAAGAWGGSGLPRVVESERTRVIVATPGLTLRLEGLGSRGGSAVVFSRDEQWWRDFYYAREEERGQAWREHLFSPGVFLCPCGASEGGAQGAAMVLSASAAAETAPTPPTHEGDAFDQARARACARAEGLVARVGEGASPVQGVLALAADQFIVRRGLGAAADELAGGVGAVGGVGGATIIAGYPWFSDWGRDTCIALPGLLLATGRLDEARAALAAFAVRRRRGLIPNCFDNGTGQAEYNTADAPLWFVLACCKLLRAGGEREHFESVLAPACLEIVQAYRDGTDFGIGIDPADGLVRAGDAGTQLTWMDAKRDGVVFTPRHGKPVELSALWYAGLMALARALEATRPRTARELTQVADQTARSFGRSFWNDARGCLFDVLQPAGPRGNAWKPDAKLRPNQIFAVAPRFAPLPPTQQAQVVQTVTEHLLTPFGLRTLAEGEEGFAARFEGPLFERDRAYHNGTVWPWLIGPYCEAMMRVEGFGAAARARAVACVAPLLAELGLAESGSMSAQPAAHANPTGNAPAELPARTGVSVPVLQLAEVYDATAQGQSPQRPEGCFAQAWSVAEVLRVLRMAQLGTASDAAGL